MNLEIALTANPVTLNQASEAQGSAALTPPIPAQLRAQFESLLARPQLRDWAATKSTPSILVQMFQKHDAALQRRVHDLVAFSEQAPEMSMQQIAAHSMAMTLSISIARMEMDSRLGVAQSLKGAMQTLLKNQ